jgi:hypothetical protein
MWRASFKAAVGMKYEPDFRYLTSYLGSCIGMSMGKGKWKYGSEGRRNILM